MYQKTLTRIAAIFFAFVLAACATSGGIQAMRNFDDVREYAAIVYADPRFVATLDRSAPIAEHVAVVHRWIAR